MLKLFFLVVVCLVGIQELKASSLAVCRDRKRKSLCERYKGLCKTNAWTKKNCKLTCGLCKAPPQTTLPPLKTTVAMSTKRPLITTKNPRTTLPGSCGTPSYKTGKVIAGENSKSGQWPWQVALYVKDKFHCGGSLIHPEWILTAAHCVVGYREKAFEIVLGDLDRSKKSGHEQTRNAKYILRHENYQKPVPVNNDLALIKLSSPALLNTHVKLICLPPMNNHVKVGTKCIISGWGKTRHPGSSSQHLQHASLEIIDKATCTRYNDNLSPLSDQMLCGKNKIPSKQSGCHGDSGGPFVCQQNDGRWVLHGAVSWGSPTCNGFLTSTVFARIASFRKWIGDNMEKYKKM